MPEFGNRCPCGHLVRRHQRADPEYRVGALVELHGACNDCSCRGQLCVAPEATPDPDEEIR